MALGKQEFPVLWKSYHQPGIGSYRDLDNQFDLLLLLEQFHKDNDIYDVKVQLDKNNFI